MARQKHILGYGVSVDEGPDGGPIVVSTEIVLPWRPRSGPFVGTAVAWRDQLFEVVDFESADGVGRWRLSPWPDSEVTRNSDTLNAEWIETLAGEKVNLQNSRYLRWLVILCSPVAGFMPASMQNGWQREHNVPAARVTVVSAIIELMLGTWWIVNIGPVMLRLFGLMVFAEAMVRLWFSLTQDEPMGSFLTAPLATLTDAKMKKQVHTRPQVEVVRWNQDEPQMTLATADPRADWIVGGVMRFRDALYQLVDTKFGGDEVVYYFEAVAPETSVTMSWALPPITKRRRQRGRGFVADGVRFIFLAFAPRRFQEQLAPRFDLGVQTLTWISAGVELFGGTVNLLGPAPQDALVGLDLLFVGEGIFRLVRTALTGLPVGSLLGLPFIAVYERWMRSDER